jgi:light-regulated signal transduction histidine kinase (bacteriophytochrome)
VGARWAVVSGWGGQSRHFNYFLDFVRPVGCRRGQPASVQAWDTGPGIPVEEQSRIFQEFYQLENPERDRDKGLGLGLAIAKRSAELLGCQLTLCSKVGVGSVFKIAIPTASAAKSFRGEKPRRRPTATASTS